MSDRFITDKLNRDPIKLVDSVGIDKIYEYRGEKFNSYADAHSYRDAIKKGDEETAKQYIYLEPYSNEQWNQVRNDFAEHFQIHDALKSRMNAISKNKNAVLNSEETSDKKTQLLRVFPGSEKDIDKNIETGGLSYGELYMYLATKHEKMPLDFMGVLASTHPWAKDYDWLPVMGSMEGITKFWELSEAIERLDNPIATETTEHYYSTEQGQKDILMLMQYLDYQATDKNFAGKVTEILKQLPAFGTEMLLTRGIATGVKKATAKAIQRSLEKVVTKRFQDKLAKKFIENKAVKTVAEKMIPGTVGAMAQATTVGIPRVKERYEEFTMPQFKGLEKDEQGEIRSFIFNEGMAPWKAFRHAYGDIAIEYISEHSGGLFKLLPDAVKSQVVKRGLLEGFKKTNPSKTYKEIMEMLEKVGYHGIFEEFMEERLGSTLRMTVGIEEWALPSLEQWLVELTAFAIPGVTAGIVGQTLDAGDKVNIPDDQSTKEFVDGFTELDGKMPRPVETGMALAEKTMEDHGKKPITRRGKITKEHRERVLDQAGEIGTTELIDFWDNEQNQDLIETSVNWYRATWKRAIAKLQRTEFPELEDVNVYNRFKALTSFFSTTAEPGPNAEQSIEIAKQWEIQGKNPLVKGRNKGGGTTWGYWKTYENGTKEFIGVLDVNVNNIQRYEALLDNFNGDTQAVEEWLMSRKTGKEIIEMSKKLGFKPPSGMALSDTIDYFGAEIFGPKIGVYWLNHSGVSTIPTIDRWMTRQIRRWMGNVLSHEGSQKFTPAEAKKEYEKAKKQKTTAKRDEVIGSQKSKITDGGKKLGKSFQQTPFDKHEMEMYRDVIREITKRFNEATGETLGVEQVQALLWYMEKDLYIRAGTKNQDLKESTYEEAIDVRIQKFQSTSATAEGVGTSEIVTPKDISKSSETEQDSETGDGTDGVQNRETDSKDDRDTKDEGIDSKKDDGKARVDEGSSESIADRNRVVSEVAKDEKDLIAGDFVKNYRAKRSDNFGKVTIDEVRDENTHVYLSEDKKIGFLLKESKNGEEITIDKIFTNNEYDSIDLMRDALAEARTYNRRVYIQIGESSDKELRKTSAYQYISDLLEPLGFEDMGDGRFFFNQREMLELDNTVWGIIKRKIANRFHQFGFLTEQVVKQRGLFEREDIETIAMLVDNKIKARLDKINKMIMNGKDGILDRVKRAGFTMDELSDYLLAKHTAERNKVVRERTEDRNATGTGMTNKEANAILKKYNNTHLPTLADEFWKKVILPERKIRLDAGLIDVNTYNAWQDMFNHYVPIREAQDDMPFYMQQQRGFEVKGSEAKRIRKGVDKAQNVVVTSLMNLEDAIVRAENNQVGLSLLNLVREFGIEGVSVRKMRYRPQFDSDGEINYMAQENLGKNDFVIKELGDYWILTIDNEGLLNALNKTGIRGIPLLDKVNGFMRGMITQWNPEFWISNFSRDLQTAGINLTAEQSSDFARKVMNYTLNPVKVEDNQLQFESGITPFFGIVHYQVTGEATNEWSQWYERMNDAGGVVSWGQFENFEEKQMRIITELEKLDKQGKIHLAGAKIKELFLGVGDGIEQGVRLSAFRVAVESGISEQQAARLARNLTVDFNTKGEWGSVINSLWLFANASVQGTRRFFQVASKPKNAPIVASLVGMSYAMTMANGGGIDPGEDDTLLKKISENMGNENAWKELSEWEKYNNLMFQTPNGGLYKVRVPYGYNVFHAIGVAIAELHLESMRRMDHEPDVMEDGVDKLVTKVFNASVDAFSPVAMNTESDLVPTPVGKVALQLIGNKSWNNSPIRPRVFNQLEKQERKVQEDTPEIYSKLADGIFLGTGGRFQEQESGEVMRYHKFGIDPHPNDLQHLVEFFTGGVGKMINRTIATGQYVHENHKFPPSQMMPFIRLAHRERSPKDKRSSLFNWMEFSKDNFVSRHDRTRFYNLIAEGIEQGVIDEDKAHRYIKTFDNNTRAYHGLLPEKEKPKKKRKVVTRRGTSRKTTRKSASRRGTIKTKKTKAPKWIKAREEALEFSDTF